MTSEDIVKELHNARIIQKKMEEKGLYNDDLLRIDHRIKHLREEAVRRGLEE